jgi:hypothetical protein
VRRVTSPPPAISETSGAAADRRPQPGRAARPGQLVPAWRVALTACWVGAFAGFAAVWKASEEIGIATWWLGPRSDPQPLLVTLIPFAITIAAGVSVAYNLPQAVWISLAASAGCALLAVFDVSRSGGLALVELAIAAATALVGLAAFSGRYRLAPADPVGDEGATASDR